VVFRPAHYRHSVMRSVKPKVTRKYLQCVLCRAVTYDERGRPCLEVGQGAVQLPAAVVLDVSSHERGFALLHVHRLPITYYQHSAQSKRNARDMTLSSFLFLTFLLIHRVFLKIRSSFNCI
jgi:hypothetical protein